MKEGNKKTIIITLSILVIFLFILLFLKKDQQRTVIKSLRTIVTYPYDKAIRGFNLLFLINRENQYLKTEVMRLTLENNKYKEYKIENERLKALLQFKEEKLYEDLIPAQIIAISGEREVGNVVINVGLAHGVAVGMPVISVKGVVGDVIEAYTETSLVKLIENVSSKVSCVDNRSGVKGILEFESQGGNIGLLKYVPNRSDVKIGDEISTSGLGGIYPQGLLVGKVIKIGNDPLGLFKKIEVEISADFSSLKEVFVLVRNKKE